MAMADSSQRSAARRKAKLLWALLRKLPLMVRVGVLHQLGLAETSPFLDLRSALTVAVVRALLEPDPARPRSVSSVQRLSTRDPGVSGRVWVSTYTSPPPPEPGARDALARAIAALADGPPACRMPEYASVEAEWTGYRAAARPGDPLPALPERAKFAELMQETRGPATVLFLHGGAHYLLDPAWYRPATKKLAKLTGGRCYSVRYRLAPRHPFPAALLDAWVSYLTLLYPPPDAFHEPVRPEHLVVAGDSAGGNLALALLQLVLELRRRGEPVAWHGQPRAVPLPAAVAVNSPWADVTMSAPPLQGAAPAVFDYLPRPATAARGALVPCDAWPSRPPRRLLYVDDGLAAHPLVSPVTAPSWAGAPPVYLCTGWELLAFEDKVLAEKLAADGVRVVFEEYEAMPHVFALVLGQTPNARRCFAAWAGFMRRAVDDPAGVEARATAIAARTLEERPLRFEGLGGETHAAMRERVRRTAKL